MDDDLFIRMVDQGDDYDEDAPTVKCKYCKQEELEWEQTPSGWRLMNPDGSLHRCIDPFEEVKRVESKIQAKQVRDESRSRRTGTHLGKTPNKRRTTLER